MSRRCGQRRGTDEDPDRPGEVRAGVIVPDAATLTPVEAAAVSGHAEMLQLLIDLGASLDANAWQRAWCVGGNSKFPIRGNRKPHTLVVGGLCPAFHDVGESHSEGAGGKCTDGRRGCC